VRKVAGYILWARGCATLLCLKSECQRPSCGLGFAVNKRLSPAAGVGVCFAFDGFRRRRSPRLGGNGLLLGLRKCVALTRALLSVARTVYFVKALQETKAWRFKSSQPACQLRRAAEDSNRFYALPRQLNGPKQPDTSFRPAQMFQLPRPRQ